MLGIQFFNCQRTLAFSLSLPACCCPAPVRCRCGVEEARPNLTSNMASCSFSFSRAHRKLCFLLLLSADRHSQRLLPVLSTATSTDFRIRCWVSTNCRSGFTTSSLSAVANALHEDLTSVRFIVTTQEYTFETWCLRMQLYGREVVDIIILPSLSNMVHTEAVIQYPLIGSMLRLWCTLTLTAFSTPNLQSRE